MNSLTLRGGPCDGDTVLVNDDVIRHGKFYYIRRQPLDEVVNTYRYKRKADKTHVYEIRRRLVHGVPCYVGTHAQFR